MMTQLLAFRHQLSGKARRLSYYFKPACRTGSAQSSQLQTVLVRREAGFTLVEMLVSVGLFAIVMVVCVAALLSLVGANKKAQALESVMNNLNISIDDMTRSLREGSVYNCGGIGIPNLQGGNNADCTNGGTVISFAPYGSDVSLANQRTVYEYVPSGTVNSGCITKSGTGGCIIRSKNGGVFSSLTAPEVSITDMQFYVVGSGSADTIQPRVIITIDGTAGGGLIKESTTFHLQATAVQRVLDL
jgi:prepilin-type N-terminal cleavage/methylation domain-containing protein